MLMRTIDSVSEIIKQIGQHKSFQEILNNIDSMTGWTLRNYPGADDICRRTPQSDQSDVH